MEEKRELTSEELEKVSGGAPRIENTDYSPSLQFSEYHYLCLNGDCNNPDECNIFITSEPVSSCPYCHGFHIDLLMVL